MRGICLGVLMAAAGAPAARALDLPPVCRALHQLGKDAETTGQPQRIAFVKARANSPLACEPGAKTPDQASFCEAATGAVGAEFHHAYPYRLYDCVRTIMGDARVTTAPEFTGIPHKDKIVRIEAKLGDGVWFETAWTPGPDADQGPNKGYYGRYDLVIWKPQP
jgi:hypothetical protein